MNVRELILKTLAKKDSVRASEIIKATGFSRAYVNRFFQQLQDEGKVILIGKANKTHYLPFTAKSLLKAKKNTLNISLILQNNNLKEDEALARIKKQTGIFLNLPQNVSEIADYAFLEMLNNAIEHSGSKTIKINMQRDKNLISFNVVDKGIGIFRNIMKKKGFNNTLEAIQDLLKGKETTAPQMHSGEGIFFTSKAADMLVIRGENKKLIFNNLLEDIFIKDAKEIVGTRVDFSIELASKRKLNAIFRQYTDSSFEFSKTMVTVKLYKMDTQYISRSQARRIVSGLDKFKTVTLDFKGINTVGQGFADEIFRVWKTAHPYFKVNIINANENIEFMIKRAKQNNF